MHAAVRDIREEIGADVDLVDLVGLYELTSDDRTICPTSSCTCSAPALDGEVTVNAPGRICRLSWHDPTRCRPDDPDRPARGDRRRDWPDAPVCCAPSTRRRAGHSRRDGDATRAGAMASLVALFGRGCARLTPSRPRALVASCASRQGLIMSDRLLALHGHGSRRQARH